MSVRTLARKRDARKSLLRNLVTSLILYEKVVTTSARAKELRSWADRVISIGKLGDLNARRRLNAIFFHRNAVLKVIEDLAPRYKKRQGGYTRWIPLGRRKGDGAEMVMLKLLPGEKIEKTKRRSGEVTKKAKKSAKSRSARK